MRFIVSSFVFLGGGRWYYGRSYRSKRYFLRKRVGTKKGVFSGLISDVCVSMAAPTDTLSRCTWSLLRLNDAKWKLWGGYGWIFGGALALGCQRIPLFFFLIFWLMSSFLTTITLSLSYLVVYMNVVINPIFMSCGTTMVNSIIHK